MKRVYCALGILLFCLDVPVNLWCTGLQNSNDGALDRVSELPSGITGAAWPSGVIESSTQQRRPLSFYHTERGGSWQIAAVFDSANSFGEVGNPIAGILVCEAASSDPNSVLVLPWHDGRGEFRMEIRTDARGDDARRTTRHTLRRWNPEPQQIFIRVSRISTRHQFIIEYSWDGSFWNFISSRDVEMRDPVNYGLASDTPPIDRQNVTLKPVLIHASRSFSSACFVPDRPVQMVMRIVNESDRTQEVELSTVLPQGWTLAPRTGRDSGVPKESSRWCFGGNLFVSPGVTYERSWILPHSSSPALAKFHGAVGPCPRPDAKHGRLPESSNQETDSYREFAEVGVAGVQQLVREGFDPDAFQRETAVYFSSIAVFFILALVHFLLFYVNRSSLGNVCFAGLMLLLALAMASNPWRTPYSYFVQHVVTMIAILNFLSGLPIRQNMLPLSGALVYVLAILAGVLGFEVTAKPSLMSRYLEFASAVCLLSISAGLIARSAVNHEDGQGLEDED